MVDMRSLKALFLAITTVAAVGVVVAAVFRRRQATGPAAPVLGASHPAVFAKSPPSRWRRLRKVLGRGSVAFVVFLLGLTVLVASSYDVSVDHPKSGAAGQGENSSVIELGSTPDQLLGAHGGFAVYGSSGDLPSSDVAIGGDQPTGPVDVAGGSRPENSAVNAGFLDLSDRLRASIADYQAQVGTIDVALAVTDLQTGQTISIQGNAAKRTGCTINMFALFAIVDRFQDGQGDPDFVSANVASGIGGSFPPEVKRFLEKIYGSYDAGLARAQEMMADWGMEVADFDHVPYYGGSDPAPNILTPLETTDILVRLWRGELFNEEWTEYTLTKLREIAPYVNYMLPAQLPPNATVAHKIGYYWDFDGWVNNDAGIVTFTGSDGGEKAYAITYMSEKAFTERIGYSFGAKLSRDVWDWFAAKYGAENNETPPWSPPPLYEPRAPVVTVAPTPVPTPQATPMPEPTATPHPTPTPFTRPTAVATATPAPTATPEATPTPAPTVEPRAETLDPVGGLN